MPGIAPKPDAMPLKPVTIEFRGCAGIEKAAAHRSETASMPFMPIPMPMPPIITPMLSGRQAAMRNAEPTKPAAGCWRCRCFRRLRGADRIQLVFELTSCASFGGPPPVCS